MVTFPSSTPNSLEILSPRYSEAEPASILTMSIMKVSVFLRAANIGLACALPNVFLY
jgi:hypothetical protein